MKSSPRKPAHAHVGSVNRAFGAGREVFGIRMEMHASLDDNGRAVGSVMRVTMDDAWRALVQWSLMGMGGILAIAKTRLLAAQVRVLVIVAHTSTGPLANQGNRVALRLQQLSVMATCHTLLVRGIWSRSTNARRHDGTGFVEARVAGHHHHRIISSHNPGAVVIDNSHGS
ncbi:hypothetical protein BC826DRAFT_971241 [Russula brevipes]|nr:hypothetical protein BC826DRAFT_971241 [Russula brevipes]